MINNIIESNIMSKVSITDKEVEEFYNERKNEGSRLAQGFFSNNI